jgi:DNA-binding MarR family transcriptional regulator
MSKSVLTGEYALVLQQIHESGEEDFAGLAQSLRFNRRRLTYIVHGLRQKGLVRVRQTRHDAWISLTVGGRQLLATMWPESMASAAQ